MDLNEFTYSRIEKQLKNLETVISENFEHEKFVFKLAFENTYEKDDVIVRFTLTNTISRTFENNGIIHLFHKLYKLSESELSESEIVLGFFEIQKKLTNLNFKYEISDSRNEDE